MRTETSGELFIANTPQINIYTYIPGVQRAGLLDITHTSHKDTKQSTIEASITLDGVKLIDPLIR
jgi:hypothetical protein